MRGAHISHCCIRHGCKYGADDCPVEWGYDQQEIPCEACMDEDHIIVVGYSHLQGKGIPYDFVLWKHGYILPLEVLKELTEKYDIHIYYNTEGRMQVSLGNMGSRNEV